MAPSVAQQNSDPIYYEQAEFIDHTDSSVFHGFFNRRGGESTGIYASLNCGAGSDDDQDKVCANHKVVADILGIDADCFLSLHQIHSAECVVVEKPWRLEDRPKADAFVTDRPGLALGILTADCAPVLFYAQTSEGKPLVGAAHAGWSGAVKGVLEATVEALCGLGADEGSMRACIGPCIGKRSYEVQAQFSEAFIEEDGRAEAFFMPAKKGGHLMFDLPGYCAFRLGRAGLKHIFIKDLDTYFNEEDFYSYRRAMHRHEKDYGRQVSVIKIHEGT